MRNITAASRCSRCGSRLLEGELVGLDDVAGEQRVLCCMCLDLQTTRFAVVQRLSSVPKPRSTHSEKANAAIQLHDLVRKQVGH